MRIAPSPIAWISTCRPARSKSATALFNSCWESIGTPFPPPTYGSSMNAVFASTVPSRMVFANPYETSASRVESRSAA